MIILKNLLIRYIATISYITLVVLINTLFVKMPLIHVMGSAISPMDFTVGFIYVVRDFAQREIKNYVIIAMLIGGLISYTFASPEIAIASVTAFLIGEFVDWAIFTFTKKPLSERILISSIVSSPVDSFVFLSVAHQLNWLSWLVMVVAKVLGVLVLWYLWYYRRYASHAKN